MFLLFLPALLWSGRRAGSWAWSALGYAFLALCLTQRQSMRFVLIAVGPMAVGVAWLASTWWDRRSRPGPAPGRALLAACLAFEAALAVARARHGLGVVAGPGVGRVVPGPPRADLRRRPLGRREPARPTPGWSARTTGGSTSPAPTRWSWPTAGGPAWARTASRPTRSSSGSGAAGFTHLLLCPPVPEDAVEFDPTLGRLLAPWLRRGPAALPRDLADADGVVRRYAIYDLDRPADRGGPAMTGRRPTPGRAPGAGPQGAAPRDRQLAGPAGRPAVGGLRDLGGGPARALGAPGHARGACWPGSAAAAGDRLGDAVGVRRRAWPWRTWRSGSTTSTARSPDGGGRPASTGSISIT